MTPQTKGSSALRRASGLSRQNRFSETRHVDDTPVMLVHERLLRAAEHVLPTKTVGHQEDDVFRPMRRSLDGCRCRSSGKNGIRRRRRLDVNHDRQQDGGNRAFHDGHERDGIVEGRTGFASPMLGREVRPRTPRRRLSDLSRRKDSPERLDFRRPRSPSRRSELASECDHIRSSHARQQPAVRLRCRKRPLLGTVVDFARSAGKTAPCMGSTMVRSSGTMRTARPNITPMPVLPQDAPMDMANFHAVYANPRGKSDDGGDRSPPFFPSAHTVPAGNPHAARPSYIYSRLAGEDLRGNRATWGEEKRRGLRFCVGAFGTRYRNRDRAGGSPGGNVPVVGTCRQSPNRQDRRAGVRFFVAEYLSGVPRA